MRNPPDVLLQRIFDDVHLDPSLDLSPAHQQLFDLLCGLWAQVRLAQDSSSGDQFAVSLLKDLESRLMAMALVLKVKSNMGR